jgi:hypothetical protein
MPYCPFRHFPQRASPLGFVRLACLIHAANVRSEPGSNPSLDVLGHGPEAVENVKVRSEPSSNPSLQSGHGRKAVEVEWMGLTEKFEVA